jgi:hypothetical protein
MLTFAAGNVIAEVFCAIIMLMVELHGNPLVDDEEVFRIVNKCCADRLYQVCIGQEESSDRMSLSTFVGYELAEDSSKDQGHGFERDGNHKHRRLSTKRQLVAQHQQLNRLSQSELISRRFVADRFSTLTMATRSLP